MIENRKSQNEFYAFLCDKKNWRPPSYSQMRAFLGVKSNQTIIERIARLKKSGKKIKI